MFAPLLFELIALVGVSAAVPAQDAQPDTICVVPIRGPLSEKMLALTVRGIRRAHELKSRAVIFELDTEGGEIGLMDRLIDEIERTQDLSTVAFVTQKALSAGALIAISCEKLYMKPGTNVGSALPISVFEVFGIPVVSAPPVGADRTSSSEKILSAMRKHFGAKAEARGRPSALAEAMVDPDLGVAEITVDGVRQFVTVTKDLPNVILAHGEDRVQRVRDVCRVGEIMNLTAQEALHTGLSDGLANSRDDLLVQLGLGGANVVELSNSWSENFAEFIQSHGLLLLIVGLVALAIEVKVPGFGLPGVVGLVCVGLYLFGKYLAGLAEASEILLIGMGLGLIAVEILVIPGTMVAGVVGSLSVLAGLVMASQQTFLPQSDRPIAEAAWWSNVRNLSLALAVGTATIVAIAHFMPYIPLLNRAILKSSTSAGALHAGAQPSDLVHSEWSPAVGARGTVRTVLRPAGKVEFGGREIDAMSEGAFVEAGSSVTVVRVVAGEVIVRAAGAASPSRPPSDARSA